ncbi:MAG: prolyl oligopeptidase family serine peptidase [Acidobacteriaceae bacterium]|nr:prolyl oligopeptidase family serine peptidase [Acidobacteriaceae bacterium]
MSIRLSALAALVLTTAAYADLPPLIDRDAFFGEVKITAAQISPDGKYIAFLKPYKDTRNIWVKAADEPFSAAKPMSAETKRPISAYFWTRDSKYLLYAQDQAGDENFNVYAINPSDPPDKQSGVPPVRNISNATGSRVMIYDVPRHDPDTMYIGINDRDKAWHDLYKLRISTGERTLVRKNTDHIAQWMFDNAGTLRIVLKTDDAGNTQILRVDFDKFTPIYSCSITESCGPIHFDHTNQKLYAITNKGADTDLVELATLDPATGNATRIENDPLKHVDIENAMFSDVDDHLLATIYEDDKERLYWKDKAYEADYKWLQSKLPRREIGFASHTADENVWIINAHTDVEPGETYIFDRKAKKLTLQYRVRDEIPRDALAEQKAIRYKSSDGLEVPAYLTLPKGVPAKNLPLVVFPHGGPWARDAWGYNTFPQFFANRGYAVLQPNFRGSTGYGKKFLNAGNGEWGRKMQDDLTWGVKYLVAEGIVNPKRVGIAGGSYGGYATLAGVAYTPDVYSAAVAIVPPSDLVFLLHSIPPYWEAMRKIMYSRMADPDTPDGKKILEAESPVNAAADIKTPLMVVQGANDPRVNKRNSDEIVIAVRDHHVPVEYIVAPDEGHGFARPINNLAMVAAMERFMAKYLDARFQESMPANVSDRLKQVTVDPTTVVLTAAVDPSKVGLPSPARDLTAGTAKFKSVVNAGGQTINLDSSSEVKDDSQSWSVVESMNTPMGAMTDSVVLDKGKLTATERHIKQGPVAIDLVFKGSKVTGTMAMNGKSKPVDVDLGGPDFADGAGSMDVIATLPLADGYKTSFYNFDVQKMQPKVMQLSVAGTENVTVPAGTFEAYKVEIAPADGGADHVTVWIAKEKHEPVKYSAVLASMGGATLTGERQ